MAKYKAYPEYKDSGVEWLGLVPKTWTIFRLKNMATIKNGQDYKFFQADDGYPVMGSGGQFTFSSKFMYDKPSVLLGRKGTIDKPLYINEPFWTVDTMYYTELKKDVDAKYLYYLALTIQFSRYSTNTALPSMTQEHLSNYKFSVPKSESERKKITEFLDHEIAKIDVLIEKQQQLIELLKEKRQAVISHAVTKGLNPDVPMKDSGVQWLGKEPAHWIKQKLVNVSEGSRGSFVNGPFGSDLLAEELRDHGVPVVYIRDIKPTGYSRKSTVFVTPMKAKQLDVCKLESGNIVVSKVGDPPGDACVYPVGEPSAIITQDVIRIRVNMAHFSPEFIAYLLNSDFGRMVVNDISVEGTRKRVSLGDFKSTRFVFPPLKESLDIVRYLNSECEKLSCIIAKATQAVAFMQERRAALISAAVTGKIDVRDWVAPDRQNVEKPQEATI